jgi:hypothetical protein
MAILSPARSLVLIKLAHTLVWALFAGCIVAIPVCVLQERIPLAAVLIAVVFLEVVVLALNGGRCPLTDVAAGYTGDRRDNFDIYLPLLVARHNKAIFGSLYLFGILFTLAQWLRTR